MITEEMLCAAASRSCDIYVAFLEKGYDPENQHEFSLKFKRKIRKLKRKADHPVFYRAAQCAASIILAILIGGTAFFTLNTEARAALSAWIKEVYETYFVYRFEGAEISENDAVGYRPTWLPEGYTEFYANEVDDTVTIVYADEEGKMLKYNFVCNPNETDWYVNAAQVTLEPATVNGVPAQLLISNDSETASAIMWTTDENTAFYISGFLSQDELIKIAESSEKLPASR